MAACCGGIWRGRRRSGGARCRERGADAADIGHATQLVAQSTFESSLDTSSRVRANTQAYLTAIQQTRPTLGPSDVANFADDIERFQRS